MPFCDTGVPDNSWDESAPAGAGFGQDAPAAPPTDDWGAAPGAGAAGKLHSQQVCMQFPCSVLLCCWQSVHNIGLRSMFNQPSLYTQRVVSHTDTIGSQIGLLRLCLC